LSVEENAASLPPALVDVRASGGGNILPVGICKKKTHMPESPQKMMVAFNAL